jgi:hypothetical protein
VVASPGYVAAHGLPQHPHDLDHRLQVWLGNGRVYRWEFERGGESMALPVPGSITIIRDSLRSIRRGAGRVSPICR